MDKFLETDSPPKMNQEELDKFEQIPRCEIEFVLIKKKKNTSLQTKSRTR